MAAADTRVVRLKIVLRDTAPPVWRRVDVPVDLTLRRLHDTIQAVFDWRGGHLHRFEADDRFYGMTEYDSGGGFGPRLYSDRNIRLGALLDRGVQTFVYRYDFGDDWEHVVTVEQVLDAAAGVAYPVLIDGARHAPPEDCGGAPGFAAFLQAMADSDHPDHADVTDWYGDDFDPEDLELDAVEAMLGRIRAGRRKGPAKGSRTSSKKVWRRPG